MTAPDEIASDAELVARLVAAQHPALVGPVTRFAEGWDNAIYRLGDAHLVRLPRREVAVDLIRTEQRWLPALAAHLPVTIPAPVALGSPTPEFPEPWSIVPFVPGRELADIPAGARDGMALQLRGILDALHRPAPSDAPVNRVRGVPLSSRRAAWGDYRARVALGDASHAVDSALAAGFDAEPWPGPALWLHGDLHPGNVLVDDGRIVALLDFGDLAAGDPATDLAIAWLGFGPAGREVLLAGVDAATAARARAWAAGLTLAFLALSADARMRGVAAHAHRQLAAEG